MPLAVVWVAEAAFVDTAGAAAESEAEALPVGESDAAAAPDRDAGRALVRAVACPLGNPPPVCDLTLCEGGVDVPPAGDERNRAFGNATVSTDVALPELHETTGALSCVQLLPFTCSTAAG